MMNDINSGDVNMNIKNKAAFEVAQQVAKHAISKGSVTSWAAAKKHLAAAYGYASIEWLEKHNNYAN